MIPPHTLPTPTNLIREFAILSARGEPIASKVFFDPIPGISDVFFRVIRSSPSTPPFFELEGSGVHCAWVTAPNSNGLILMTYTKENLNPCLVCELLHRIVTLIADYCGTCSEASIKRNQQLVYEILDEVVDGGIIQSTSAEYIKTYISGEPSFSNSKSTTDAKGKDPAQEASVQQRSILSTGKASTHDLFVDVEETINQTLAPDGTITFQRVEGCVKVKSYLSGNPGLLINLSNNLIVESEERKTKRDDESVVIHSCNFHQCVKTDVWEQKHLLRFVPPEGEVNVMNFLCKTNIKTPIKLLFAAEPVAGRKHQLQVVLKLRAEFNEKAKGSKIQITLPLPKETTTAQWSDLTKPVKEKHGVTFEYRNATKTAIWGVARLAYGEEIILKAKVAFPTEVPTKVAQLMGPVSAQFEVTNHTASGLTTQSVVVDDNAKFYTPNKWLRNSTISGAFVVRVH